jgi:hypothetical protein
MSNLFQTLAEITRPPASSQPFIDRQNQLNAKLARIKAIEAGFTAKGWHELSKKVNFDLNTVYDLQHKIEDQLRANWSEYKDWHYDNFGFNTYP